MKSNNRLRADLLAWGVAAACAAGVARAQPVLAERFHGLKAKSDVYAIPSPDQTVVASLGYRAALADLLYAHVLVSYGLHFQEKRRFEFVGNYLDTINALDPEFRAPYRFADTLLVMQPEPPRAEDYAKAAEILERGLRNRPYDTELWLTAGQFYAYLAPPYLESDAEKARFRKRGAEILARTCELASDNENIPYHCITAAGLFEKAGQREAAIESLRRVLAVNDDPEIERMALGYLEKQLSDRERERFARRKHAFEEVWREDLPFVSKDTMLLLTPPLDVAACAGPSRADEPGCETTWARWAENLERRLARETP